MSYNVSARDYLLRAQKLLNSTDERDLFYAAFELRAGVEARLAEYLEVHAQVSRKLKAGWRVAVLGKGIDRTFKLGNQLARFGYADAETRREEFILYYTPVSRTLRKHAQKLGEYLHRQKKTYPNDHHWWTGFRNLLGLSTTLLQQSCMGTMLGPPLIQPNGRHIHTYIEVVEGSPADLADRLQPGRRFVAKISYPKKFPDEFEANAIVWRAAPNMALQTDQSKLS